MTESTTRTPLGFELSIESRADGAMFKVQNPSENGPVMSGVLHFAPEDAGTVPLSAFMRTSRATGEIYLSLSLSLGAEGGVHYYGKLFRNSAEKRFPTTPDYNGFVTLLPCTEPSQYTDEEWDAAPTLRICGWRKRNADGGARVALYVASRDVQEGELPF